MTLIVTCAVALLALAGLACFLLAMLAARRLVLPHDRPSLEILACDDQSVTVRATQQTLHPGTFGIWAVNDQHHTIVGEVLHHDENSRTVQRRIIQPTGRPLHPGERVTWTAHVFPGPASLSTVFENVELPVDGGIAPAWLIPGPEDCTRWAIHIHGIRTTRTTALRSVPAANKADMTSLVVSFRGDGEAPTSPNRASMLGSTEWQDLEPAIDYAAGHGATEVTLIAWSMGAEVALNYLRKGKRSQLVNGLVLIAPITDWNEALDSALRRAHLPVFLGAIAAWLLATPRLHKIAGSMAPISLTELDWTKSKQPVPALIVHSSRDNEAPIEASRRLARTNPFTTKLLEWSSAGHALEYNTDRDRFTGEVAAWLSERRRSNLDPSRGRVD